MGLWLELLGGDTQQAADELGKRASFDHVWDRCFPKTVLMN